jgi:hypothetical protein
MNERLQAAGPNKASVTFTASADRYQFGAPDIPQPANAEGEDELPKYACRKCREVITAARNVQRSYATIVPRKDTFSVTVERTAAIARVNTQERRIPYCPIEDGRLGVSNSEVDLAKRHLPNLLPNCFGLPNSMTIKFNVNVAMLVDSADSAVRILKILVIPRKGKRWYHFRTPIIVSVVCIPIKTNCQRVTFRNTKLYRCGDEAEVVKLPLQGTSAQTKQSVFPTFGRFDGFTLNDKRVSWR